MVTGSNSHQEHAFLEPVTTWGSLFSRETRPAAKAHEVRRLSWGRRPGASAHRGPTARARACLATQPATAPGPFAGHLGMTAGRGGQEGVLPELKLITAHRWQSCNHAGRRVCLCHSVASAHKNTNKHTNAQSHMHATTYKSGRARRTCGPRLGRRAQALQPVPVRAAGRRRFLFS